MTYKELCSIWEAFDQKDNIVILHVKLKGLSNDYHQLTYNIINSIRDVFTPKSILVPTFTYSFIDTRRFSVKHTTSEVGRFSEEVRLRFAKYRTPDPIFSFADTEGFLSGVEGVNFGTAFGERSLCERLEKIGHTAVNINTPNLISTHLHFLEKKFNVPYRKDRIFVGDVVPDNGAPKQVSYEYFCRDLNENPTWDRQKIESVLIEQGALVSGVYNDLNVRIFESKKVTRCLEPLMLSNPRFLLNE